MTSPESPQDRVLGTIVGPGGYRPFIYHIDEGRLELDFVYNPTQGVPEDGRRRELERRIGEAFDGEVTEVRIGQYHCYDCDGWFVLDGSSWSLGMCFNCSFDRSSDIADRS